MEFWNSHDVKGVADFLLGAPLVFGDIEATVLRTEAYSRRDNDQPLYRPMLEMGPGQVYCPRRRNAILVLVTALDHGQQGGCVLIRAAEVGGVVYDGPGHVSQRLGITEARSVGTLLPQEDETFVLAFASMPPLVRKPQRAWFASDRGNGIGAATLRLYMQKIVGKYMRTNPGIPFKDFVNGILEQCTNEKDLRRALR